MRRALLFLVCLLLVAGGAYWWLAVRAPAIQQARGRRGPDTIPVVAAAATTSDVPIYLTGLGTVQASATVTVHTLVDGTLEQVDFQQGRDVKVGQVLARIDPRTYQAALDQAVAKKAQDDATLANAKTDLVRYKKLAATAYTSEQQYATQKSLVAQLTAQVAGDQAQIDTARTQLSYTTITSPVNGRAGILLVDAGNIVHASDSTGLVVLTTLHPIDVLFTLPQQDLAQVRSAMQAGTPDVEALPEAIAQATSPKILDRGTLTVLDNEVDPSTGTIKLKASFPNPKLTLWPGAFITVQLHVATEHNAVVVPPVAVQRGPQGPYLYVVNADSTVSRRNVELGHEDLVAAIVTDGLKPGERVVTDGASRLTDKAKVTVLPPTAATPATKAPATQVPGAPAAQPAQTAGGRRKRDNT